MAPGCHSDRNDCGLILQTWQLLRLIYDRLKQKIEFAATASLSRVG